MLLLQPKALRCVVSAFLSDPDSSTLLLVVFSRTQFWLYPEIDDLGTLFITAVTIAFVLNNIAMRKREKQRIVDMHLTLEN